MTRKDGLVQVMRGARSDVRDGYAAAAKFEKQALSSVPATRDLAVTSMDFALNAAAGESRPVARFALCNGGVLRIPRRKRNLRVLSGTAWISADGKDIVASAGDCIELARTRYPPWSQQLAAHCCCSSSGRLSDTAAARQTWPPVLPGAQEVSR